MTLSTWDTLQVPNSAPPPNHHFPYSDESFHLYDNYFHPTCDFFHPSHQLFPCTDPFISFTHHTFPTEDYQLLPCPKRRKCFYEEQEQPLHFSLEDFAPSNFLDHNLCVLQEDPEQVPPESVFCSMATEFKVPQQCTFEDFQCEKKGNDRTVSAQSIAARERRRKIAEKTHELGSLIPDGPKMNTAEMLHAAAKYVKYLQAQVDMLQLIKTVNEEDADPSLEKLHALVISPIVQEKLYSKESCLVPKEFVTTLTNYNNVQWGPTIIKDLKELIGPDTEKKAEQE
ncbi:transcription factor bHLH52-like [Abrus precatorius]|uniref:Transcription factor bHLH52-like n=1 Tax=Abrus precatorius TaxID=3816 RepID=A0A8B8KID2_ABRPR|nr:transcription factor bHLH52-like [Abrus precatorius]